MSMKSILKPVIKQPKTCKLLGKKKYASGNFCVAPGCSNSSGKDKERGINRSYYRFPKEEKRRRLWLKAIPREQWIPSDYAKICSDHFIAEKKSDDVLSPSYVPTVFTAADSLKGKKPQCQRHTKTALAAGTAQSWPTLGKAMKASRNHPKQKKIDLSVGQSSSGRPVLLKPAADSVHYPNAVWSTTNHDYVCGRPDTGEDENTENISLIKELIKENDQLKFENEKIMSQALSLESVTEAGTFRQWTNLPNREVFDCLSSYFKKEGGLDLKYWKGSDTSAFGHYKNSGKVNKPGPERKLSYDEELFLVLVKLKTGYQNQHLAHFFGLSDTYVSQVFTTHINFMHHQLKALFQLSRDDSYHEGFAACFKQWPNLRTILDCTELQVQKSSNFQARKELFSNYKQRDTVKFMVGLSPNLCVNYVSKAWGGRASDKAITLDAEDLLEALPEGSAVMSDRGFNLSQELRDRKVHLIIPSFKGRDRSQMTKEECQSSETIAKARIHIERIIQRIRTFHILDRVVTLTMKDTIEQIFTVCAYLTNFQAPIIKDC